MGKEHLTLAKQKLILILGDQLNLSSPCLKEIDKKNDRVIMIEAADESTSVWSSKQRIVLFLSAMRHFAERLKSQEIPLEYLALHDPLHAGKSIVERLASYIAFFKPSQLLMLEAGEWRLNQGISALCEKLQVPLMMMQDPHFLCSHQEFQAFAKGKKRIIMENFYRTMRRRENVLMNGEEPIGGEWNFDSENRKSFGSKGPQGIQDSIRFLPDFITQQVIEEVSQRFADHPGTLDHFGWPVTREDALAALHDFIQHRLITFGTHQDAMWTDQPFLSHALIGSSLNLKLLDPREVIQAAEAAFQKGSASIQAVEGFIRQILGWREFIRGMYWLDMPAMKEANHFNHHRPLPEWFWTGNTQMRCMNEVITSTLAQGYAHHIQRLMVLGLFGLVAEINPKEVSDWFLSVYVDAVEWVELPNVMGMALFANGGRFTSKPYVASGAYIHRMSNYCKQCPYQPEQKVGEQACPITQLYWNFLDNHEQDFASNPRTTLMIKNLQRMEPSMRAQIKHEAEVIFNNLNTL
jgi:deoxyribodipyrimidine photolyase-related protein